MESRLSPVARREGYESVSDLLAAIRARREEPLIWSAVEAMAGTETCFSRDRGAKPVRVWSAACAAGQEVYSLAMIALDMMAADPTFRIELAASDLSRLALERAQSGLYNQFEVQRGLPIRLLAQHFEKEGDQWRISPELRQLVRWRRINLIAGLKPIGQFDVVFCRYVLGIMTDEAQRRVVQDLAYIVPDDGYLVLGAKESISAVAEAFTPVVGRPGLYRRNPAARAAA